MPAFLSLRARTAAIMLALAGAHCPGFAQTTATVYEEQHKLIRAPQAIASIGTDLFGDTVNLYNGALEFVQTDVSLPGNFALPVSVGRRLTTGTDALAVGAFGRWELEVPHLHGLFAKATGWKTNQTNTNRCTEFGKPPDNIQGNPNNSGWSAKEYWHGNMMYVPGLGDQEMLRRNTANTNVPSTGGPFPVVTRDLWVFECLATVANGLGQGFLAQARTARATASTG